jgi:SAM-dependent MidA family methyltransferase
MPNLKLPLPDAAALALSQHLIERIHAAMQQAGGSISCAEFMQLALYAPGMGYYSNPLRKFGAGGDFVTAPEISPLFGVCVARQCAQVLQTLDGGDIVEFGAGSGALAADLLAELKKLDCLPQAYYIIELSADLAQRQRETLQARVPHLAGRVRWLEELPAAPLRGVFLGNEVLDAMPAWRFQIGDGVLEWRVGIAQDGSFAWLLKPAGDELSHAVAALELPPGYSSEINLALPAWMQSVAGKLSAGLILLLDYGFPRREYYHPQRHGGTLMCHYRHYAHPDVFWQPGLQDITAHVDFTALALAAHEAGLRVAGYASQADFLLSCGILELLQADAARAGAVDAAYLSRASQAQRLLMPQEMGELFKAIAFTRQLEAPLLGFARDRRERL